jgi:hypothetical protein
MKIKHAESRQQPTSMAQKTLNDTTLRISPTLDVPPQWPPANPCASPVFGRRHLEIIEIDGTEQFSNGEYKIGGNEPVG